MAFVIVNTSTHSCIRHPKTWNEVYPTERGAKISMASLKKMDRFDGVDMVVMDTVTYRDQVPMIKVINMMSGIEIEIAADTPACCDLSRESYWSM